MTNNYTSYRRHWGKTMSDEQLRRYCHVCKKVTDWEDGLNILTGEFTKWLICCGCEEWTPTPDNVNRLPEKICEYVHDLVTMSDPAGIIAENVLLRDELRMIRKKLEEGSCNCND